MGLRRPSSYANPPARRRCATDRAVRPARDRTPVLARALTGLVCALLAGASPAQGSAVRAVREPLPVSDARSGPAAPTPAAEPLARPDAQMTFLLDLSAGAGPAERTLPLAAFSERIARAAISHPEALAAKATVRATEQATRETAAAGLPQIDTRLDVAQRDTQQSLYLGIPARRYAQASAGLNLRQNVFDFGAISTATAAGRDREQAAAAYAQGRRHDLALQAIQAWLDVCRVRMRLELARLNVQALSDTVGFLQQRYELGAGLLSDTWRARSRLADARAGLATAQAALRSNEAAYAEIFREPPGALELPPLAPLDRRAVAADTPALVSAFPTVRSAEAAHKAAAGEADANQRRTLPQVSLELNALRRGINGQEPNSNEAPANDLSATLVLRYSFYTGGANTARVEQLGYRAAEAGEQARATSLQVERALAQAIADDEHSAAVLEARREEVVLAVESLRAVRELFANRRGSLLDVLSAQEGLNQAGIGLVDAQIDQIAARWRALAFTPAFWPLAGVAPGSSDTAESDNGALAPPPAQGTPQ